MNAQPETSRTDLLVLVADNNMEAVARGLLARPQALGIRPLTFDSIVHPRRDPGIANEAHTLLRPYATDYRRALVLLDHEGSGRHEATPEALAAQVKKRLEENGWEGRAEVVVLAPELEVWVWSASPHVDSCLGWAGRRPDLRAWLQEQGRWPEGQPKPTRPKEAMETALREVRKPRSSAIYLDLARTVSLAHHTEPAFLHFTETLKRWFPA
jgi:hypothetical protein